MREISPELKKRMSEKLVFLYGLEGGERTYSRLERSLIEFPGGVQGKDRRERFDEKDVILITYGDMIRDHGHPLKVLDGFAKKYLKERINTIHILPFFEYDSDRGFSVIDHRRVDPRLGDWNDVDALKGDFKLMFDLIVNHVSDKHRWFNRFMRGDPRYRDYFIWFDGDRLPSQEEVGMVFRPRSSPLLTRYETSWGEKYVWTTFPLNQVDLNFRNEEVLLDVIDILLFYVGKGADLIRLDAVAFIWKELGTSCLHLKQTHVIVQLFRDVLDAVAPGVSLVTETNVPHEENVTYFGDDGNEAQMVYNFTLPPLVLHALYMGDATRLSRWAEGLGRPFKNAAFLNFLDSHDGIGLLGAEGILTRGEIDEVVKRAVEDDGLVSYKKNTDGVEIPYEVNTTWWSALTQGDVSGINLETQVRRYLVSRAIALSLKGVPGIYLNGLLGALNDRAGAEKTGNKRDINRRNFEIESLSREVRDEKSRVHMVFSSYLNLIGKRVGEKAFNPNGDQRILHLDRSVFSLVRTSPDGTSQITALHNLSSRRRTLTLEEGVYHDIISDKKYGRMIDLDPYQTAWLKRR